MQVFYPNNRGEIGLDPLQAIILALIQGITEFLPISSSAHLVLPSHLLGWSDQGLAFDTAVHLGSLIAVITFFWRDLVRLILAGSSQILGNSSEDGRFAVNLLIASLPIIPVGFFARFLTETELRNLEVIAVTSILFALVLWYADRLKREESQILTLSRALMIGIAQCLALIPGTSRSGITMTAALLIGFSRTDAARISFLISIPAILGAATLKLFDLITQSITTDWLAVGIGTLVSGISAYLCIRFLLGFIERIGFLPFVIYRLILGIFLIVIMAI